MSKFTIVPTSDVIVANTSHRLLYIMNCKSSCFMSIFDTSLNDTFAKILLTMYVNIIDTTNKTKEINIDTLIAEYTKKEKVAKI